MKVDFSYETEYPSSDGQPIADNTRQCEYIVTLQGGLDAQFHKHPDVLVAADNLWYPVEGRPDIRTAPDVYVAFGRPRGHRAAYLQWRENDIAPQVVIEVLSPCKTVAEKADKFAFYDRYGVEEYYEYDPDNGRLLAWLRSGHGLMDVPSTQGFISPRLGVRFELNGTDLRVFGSNGRRFLTFRQLYLRLDLLKAETEMIQQQAEVERLAWEIGRRLGDRERSLADLEHATARADEAADLAADLAAKLLALGVDPKSI